MGTPNAQYPHETLTQIGSKLTGIHQTLDSDDKGAKNVDGLSGDQNDINDKIGDFRDEWEASIKKLKENIGTLGTLSGNIGTMVAGFDSDLAKGLKPGGGSGGGGGGNSAV